MADQRRRDLHRYVWDWGDGGPLFEQRSMLVALAEELESTGRVRMADCVRNAACKLDELDRQRNLEDDERREAARQGCP